MVFMNILCKCVFPETFDSEEDQLKHDLLHGGYNLNDLPKIPSSVVKLYVCASRKGRFKNNYEPTVYMKFTIDKNVYFDV